MSCVCMCVYTGFFLSFCLYFSVVSRSTYDAFLFFLLERNAGRPIDWGASVLQKYVSENNSEEEQPLDFKLESNRRNFVRKASRYDVLVVNEKTFLSKLEKGEETAAGGKSVFVKKRVICDDEYERLLQDHHDKKNHLGFIKCYYEVGTLDFIITPPLYNDQMLITFVLFWGLSLDATNLLQG